MKKHLVLAAALVTGVALSGPVMAADSTVRVDSNDSGGWVFNPDPANATDYEFVAGVGSLGTGSLFVEPIGPDGAEKFIAALPSGVQIAALDSVSYDFQMAGTVAATSFKQFYANVYTLLPTSAPDKFNDCRFDFVSTEGSAEAFTTSSFTPMTPRSGGTGGACPQTMAGMPEGSTIRAVVLNVGGTGTSDNGLAGFLDNVVVAVDGTSVAYDFEAAAPSKEACKKDGFATYGYSNQGACVSLFGGKA